MNLLLRILSWLYAVGVGFRNLLYDEHVLHSFQPALPTICVGNLAVGGTGKTPHVEYLVRLLTENGYRVAVLSRGYKRRTKGFVEADDKAPAATIGDESMQLKRKFPNIVVAVCEDRYIGIRRLKRRHADLDVVVLDDAFQHRRIKPGLSILLTQADRLYVEDQLLPLGRLREPAEGSLRANIVVVTKCPKGMQPIDQRIIDTKLHVLPAQTLVFTRMKYLDWDAVFDPNGNKPNKPNKVLLVTGIAQPQYLVEHMQESAAAVCSLTFPDHHVFSEKDIRRIRETFEQEHCDLIVTTEKDAVRLRECRSFPEELKPRVFAQPIETEFLQKDITTFNTIVLRYVRESKRNR